MCPPLRALLVNLKHHPYQAYWFLHRSHRTSFQITYARPLAKCQGLFASLVLFLGGTVSSITYHREIVKVVCKVYKTYKIIKIKLMPVLIELELVGISTAWRVSCSKGNLW